MKIGFIGNLANNMYLFAKHFRAMGAEAHYYHIPSDFMFSQPFWEELDLFVPYEQLNDPQSIQKLRGAWNSPAWVREGPVSLYRGRLGKYLAAASLLPWQHLTELQGLRELTSMLYPFFKKELQSCDWLMVTTIAGLLAGVQAGVPYLYWPHGQDLRDAVGQREFLHHPHNIAIVRRGVEQALLCGSHGSDMNLLLKEVCGPEKVNAIPYLIDCDAFRLGEWSRNFLFFPKK